MTRGGVCWRGNIWFSMDSGAGAHGQAHCGSLLHHCNFIAQQRQPACSLFTPSLPLFRSLPSLLGFSPHGGSLVGKERRIPSGAFPAFLFLNQRSSEKRTSEEKKTTGSALIYRISFDGLSLLSINRQLQLWGEKEGIAKNRRK